MTGVAGAKAPTQERKKRRSGGSRGMREGGRDDKGGRDRKGRGRGKGRRG